MNAVESREWDRLVVKMMGAGRIWMEWSLGSRGDGWDGLVEEVFIVPFHLFPLPFFPIPQPTSNPTSVPHSSLLPTPT